MLTHFDKTDDSKELFFKLGNSFHITNYSDRSSTSKFAGLYAIYKNGNCMYVGQSQNLASRLSQHLTGKYESADMITVFMATDYGFNNFYDMDKDSRKSLLEDNEKILIKKLKPIENLMLPDQNFSIPESRLFSVLNFINDENFNKYELASTVIEITDFDISVSCFSSDAISTTGYFKALKKFIKYELSFENN